MSLDISIDAQRIIDTHKFAITMAGKAFVVRDPTNRKLGRFEGPELLPLLHQAVAAKGITVVSSLSDLPPDNPPIPTPPAKAASKTKSKKQTAASPPGLQNGLTDKQKSSRAAAQQKANTPPTPGTGKTIEEAIRDESKDEDEPDEFEADELDDTGGKQAKTKKQTVKKTPLEWTTGRIGVLILKHADKSDTEIFEMCQKQGIKTKLLTVKGLRRYFRLCLECQIAIAEETEKLNGDIS